MEGWLQEGGCGIGRSVGCRRSDRGRRQICVGRDPRYRARGGYISVQRGNFEKKSQLVLIYCSKLSCFYGMTCLPDREGGGFDDKDAPYAILDTGWEDIFL